MPTIVSTPLTGSAVMTTANATNPVKGVINIYDATNGAISKTLPALSSLTLGARLAVQKYTGDSSSNTVTISCAGSDTFVNTSMSSVVLSVPGEQREVTVVSVSGTRRWAHVGTWLPLSSLDSRFAPATSGTSLLKGSGSGGFSAAAAGTDYATSDDTLSAFDQTSGEPTMPRMIASSGTVVVGSGSARLVYFKARKTETITQVRLISGSTAAVWPSSGAICRVCIYSVAGNGDLTLVASSANPSQPITLLTSTQTIYTVSLSASWSKTRGTTYAAGLFVSGATTSPQLCGVVPYMAPNTSLSPRLGGSVSGADVPSSVSAASVTGNGHLPYIELVP